MDKSTAGRSLLYSTWLIEILCWSIDQTTWCSGPMQAGCVAGPSSGAFGRRIDSVERYCRFNSTAFWYLALRRMDRFPFNGSYQSRDLESHLLLSWVLCIFASNFAVAATAARPLSWLQKLTLGLVRLTNYSANTKNIDAKLKTLKDFLWERVVTAKSTVL